MEFSGMTDWRLKMTLKTCFSVIDHHPLTLIRHWDTGRGLSSLSNSRTISTQCENVYSDTNAVERISCISNSTEGQHFNSSTAFVYANRIFQIPSKGNYWMINKAVVDYRPRGHDSHQESENVILWSYKCAWALDTPTKMSSDRFPA